MQRIVIEIPENIVTDIKDYCGMSIADAKEALPIILNAIHNGTPLPKGHGRLMILSENRLKENQIDLDFSCQKWISEVGLSNATVTIIEADKEQADGNNMTHQEALDIFKCLAWHDLRPSEEEIEMAFKVLGKFP